MEPIAIEDDGFVDVSLGGVTKRLDLYDTFNEMRGISAATEDDPAAFAPRVQQFLNAHGFPGVSQRAAARVAAAVYSRVEELRKKDSAAGGSSPPASAGSSGSGSATCPPASGSASSSPPTGSKRKKP